MPSVAEDGRVNLWEALSLTESLTGNFAILGRWGQFRSKKPLCRSDCPRNSLRKLIFSRNGEFFSKNREFRPRESPDAQQSGGF